MTEPEPETPEETPETPQETPETPEEKRARVMHRLAEMIRGDPPGLSGSGPVSAGGFPELPNDADEFDQESAAELFAAMEQFFKKPDRPR